MNFQVRALIIGAVTIILMVLVFVWMVVLDKAKIAVSAEGGAFELEVDGDRIKRTKRVTCSTVPCMVSVPGGTYTLTLRREGFFPAEEVARVARGETASVTVTLSLIPSIEEIGMLAEADALVKAAFAPEDLSRRFALDIDPVYGKQRLSFFDDEKAAWTVWAYFDRTLEEARVFPHPNLTQVLVAGKQKTENGKQKTEEVGSEASGASGDAGGSAKDAAARDAAAGAQDNLYLVDGEALERTFVATVPALEKLWWSPDTSWVLGRTRGPDGVGSFILVNAADGMVREWPFSFSPDKVVWVSGGRLVFATTGEVDSLVNKEPVSTLTVVKSILDGTLKEPRGAFEFGEYDVTSDRYRALDKVDDAAGVDYSTVRLGVDSRSGRVFFTDGTRVFEVVR